MSKSICHFLLHSMGGGLSQALRMPPVGSLELTGTNESIFEISADERAFAVDLATSIFQQTYSVGNELWLPEENMIVDVVMDPVALSQVNSPVEVWQDVLIPLFSGSARSRPRAHQLLDSIFRFLKERPTQVLDQDDQKRETEQAQRHNEIHQVVTLHRHYRHVLLEVNDEMLSNISEDLTSLLRFIPSQGGLSYHSEYEKVTTRILGRVTDAESALIVAKWGLFSGSLSAIVEGLVGLIEHGLNKKKAVDKDLTFRQFAGDIKGISLSNILAIPLLERRLGYTKVHRFKLPETQSRCMMACDGKSIYLLGGHGMVTIVSMSNMINNVENRFRSVDLHIPKMKRIDTYLAVSHGVLLVNGPFLDKEQIYTLKPFEKCKQAPSYLSSHVFGSSPKISSPIASDGRYLYSVVEPKKIAVFSFEDKHIVFHRYINLRKGAKKFLTLYSTLVPKAWMETALVYTTGTVFSFLVLRHSGEMCFEYFVRHFSLLTGVHLGDHSFTLQWPILSVVFDPWNSCLWALSHSQNEADLIKLPSYSGMPPWLTGIDATCVPDPKSVVSDFRAAKSAHASAIALGNFLELFAAHLVGASVLQATVGTDSDYSVATAQIFCPANPTVIRTLLNAAKVLIQLDMSEMKKKTVEYQLTYQALQTLMALLQYNLSNYHVIGSAPLPSELSLELIDFLKAALVDKKFMELRQTAAFILVKSFSTLFKTNMMKAPEVFLLLWTETNDDFLRFAVETFNSLHVFPYCFCPVTCREIISPMLEKLLSHESDLPQQDFEMISLFQCSLMTEMRRICLSQQASLPDYQEQLQQTFFLYSRMMTERVITFLSGDRCKTFERSVQFSKFFKLFRKWLMLLQPLSKFLRVSQSLVFLLHPLFNAYVGSVVGKMDNDSLFDEEVTSFAFAYSVFFELFSIYLDFIGALLDGGTELQEASHYFWLVRSTLDAKITAMDIRTLKENLLKENTDPERRKKSLRRGISFNYVERKSGSSDEILDFVAKAVLPTEDETVAGVFSYFYKKVKGIMAIKDISANDKHTERLLFLAFMKQLGFGQEVLDVSEKLAAGEQPVLSHFIRMTMECIYRIRRELRLSRQITAQFQERAATSQVPLTPKLAEDYPAYVETIREKCVFLISIAPCLRFQQYDMDTAFPDMLKRIQTFLLGPINIMRCFQLIEEAESARKHIATGIRLVNEVLESRVDRHCSTFMLDRLSASDSIMKYLSSLHAPADSDGKGNPGFGSLRRLLDLISKMITQTRDSSVANTLIIFYLNLVMTIGRMDQEAIFEPIVSLIQNLVNKKDDFEKGHYSSYLALVASCMYACLCETPALTASPHFHELKQLLFPNASLSSRHLSLARICYRVGSDVPFDGDSIISFLKEAPPAVYHPVFSVFLEVIEKSQDRIRFFHWLFKEIAAITSGGQSSLLKDRLPLDQMARAENNCVKTPEILLGVCSDMIQLCRRCLVGNGEARDLVRNIITYVLLNAQGRAPPSRELESFQEPMFLFAVFAILSNSIETIRRYSLILDTITNSLLYVTDIQRNDGCYVGWKLPITGESVPVKVPFANTINPASSIPFSASLFDELDLLMPLFMKYLTGTQNSNRENALTYYVLASLSAYCSEKQFMDRLFNGPHRLEIKSVSFDSSSKSFMELLRMHLGTTSNGFAANSSSGMRLMFCAPVNYFSAEDFTITSNSITTGKGLHVFVSSVLSQDHPAILQVTGRNNFNAGLHLFSVNPVKSSLYLYCGRNRQILYNSTRIKAVDAKSSLQTITIAFYPAKKKCCFFYGSEMKKVNSMNLSSTSACFVLHLFDECQIQYQLSTVPPHSTSIGQDLAKRICPMSGQTISRRNRRKPMNLKEALKGVPYRAEPASYSDTNAFSLKYESLQEELPNMFISDLSVSSIIRYPVNVVKECGHVLNTKKDKVLGEIAPAFVSFNTSVASNYGLPVPMRSYSELRNSHNVLITKFSDTSDVLYSVDEDTGEVTHLDPSSVSFVDVSYLEPIHPRNYPILPPELINFFATGLMLDIRNQTVNQIALKIFASSQTNVESAMKLFNLDDSKLLQYALSLVVFAEPLRVQLISDYLCPIDFKFDVLNPSHSVPFAKHSCKSALINIFAYLMEPSRIDSTMELWMKLLMHQFGNPKYHFVDPEHLSALILPIEGLTEEKQIVMRGVSCFIIYRGGFSRSPELLVEISQHDGERVVIKGSISDNILVVEGDNIIIRRTASSDCSIVILPVSGLSNSWAFGTMFTLPILLKYFVLTLHVHGNSITEKLLQEMKTMVYQAFIDSYISQSPFFYNFARETLQFIHQNLALHGGDLVGDLPLKLSLLSIYNSPPKTFISQFLEEQQMLWDERMLLSLKTFFPEFLTEADKKYISQLTDTSWMLPSPAIPQVLDSQTDFNQLASYLKRILRPRTTILGYPFHLLLHLWVEYASTYPAFDVTTIDSRTLKVTLLWDDIDTCQLLFRSAPSFCHAITDDFESRKVGGPVKVNPETRSFYLWIMGEDTKWDLHSFYVKAAAPRDPEQFIRKFRDRFVDDIVRFVLHWDVADDEIILSNYGISEFQKPELRCIVQPSNIWDVLRKTTPFHIVCVRTIVLLALNWMLYRDKISFDGEPALKSLCRSMSSALRNFRFRELVDQQSQDCSYDVRIDRRTAVEVRRGASNDLKCTIMSQLASGTLSPKCFKRPGDKPWHVTFVGETGIDAGGLARELVAEAAADIVCPNCGLFIPVPNARNEVGGNRDYVIPFPNKRHQNIMKQYAMVGAVIGICIRSSIVQDLNFAPFIWDFLAGGTLTIADVFEVDENYKVMIESLEDALKSNMDDAAFQNSFNLRFVVTDFRGEETPLTQMGRLERVTLSNCSEFISLANEFRLSQLREPLQAILQGLWENLDFKPPAFLSGDMLEAAACGSKEISFDEFMGILRLDRLAQRDREILTEVIRSFTSEQRSALLKFTTGRVRLPTYSSNELFRITVDNAGTSDRLPTASTCFNQLHLPWYSSIERARKMIGTAIDFTATFENR